MQLMPQTASTLGVRDPFDARQNITAGVRHLRGLMDRFDDDLPRTLAAYNAGERAVTTYGGIPPYPRRSSTSGRSSPTSAAATGWGDAAVFFKLVQQDGSVTFTNVAPQRTSASIRSARQTP